MSSPYALPTVFRARVLEAIDLPWLVDGFHYRIKAHPWIGFPIHPFAAWSLSEPADPPVPVPMVWRDDRGRARTMPFVVTPGSEFIGAVPVTTGGDPWVWTEFDVDDGGLRIDVLDSTAIGSGPRILMTRTAEPFRFGDAELLAFRVTGKGRIKRVEGHRASAFSVREAAERRPSFVFGLPRRSANWYAPDRTVDPRAAAAARVRAAAPTRRNPPDNPTGAHPGTTQAVEADRILNVVGPQLVDPWLARLLGSSTTPPALTTFTKQGSTPNGKPLTVNAPVAPSLFTMAVDPQIARYLGLATFVSFHDSLPDIHPGRPLNAWLVASRWIVQRNRLVRKLDDSFAAAIPMSPAAASLPLNAFLPPPGAVPGFIDDRLDDAFPDAQAIISRLPGVSGGHAGPWTVATLLTLAIVAGRAPPDPPDPFDLESFQHGSWNPHSDPDHPGGATWQQMISLGARPARGMVGFARMSPGEPIALHQFAPVHGQPAARALPLVPNWASNHERLLTDRLIPAAPGGASWQVWHADEFGQWSAGSHLARPLPPRPLPPTPQVEATYIPAPDDHSVGPRVPGVIHLVLDVPRARLSAPGSLPIDKLELVVDGVAQPAIDVSPGEHIARDFHSQAFPVGRQRQVPIVAAYVDAGNRKAPSQTLSVGVYDARVPQPIPTSPMVAWTGEPDATGHAELALKWPPMAGATRYRVYLGDVRRLAGASSIALADGRLRAANAKRVHTKSKTFDDKHLFTFLGEISGATAADGLIHYSTQIPGSLRGLQFVRIVPTTQGGAEAPFAGCGLVPVAIPGVDRPPPPLVDTVSDATGVQLTIRAQGLRKELVAAGAGKAPQYRIRRTRGGAPSRAYVPIVSDGARALTGPDARGVWKATVSPPKSELDPFVRYRWFAEVRYPAEPPLPPNVTAEPVDGGVEPVWTKLGASSAGLWSDLSLAAESLMIPPNAPRAPAAPTMTRRADGSVEVKVERLPVAASGAIGVYRLELYHASPGKAPELVGSPATTKAELIFTVPAAVPNSDDYLLVVADPIGRRSKPTRVSPPA